MADAVAMSDRHENYEARFATMSGVPQISRLRSGSDPAVPRFTQGLPEIRRRRKTIAKSCGSTFLNPIITGKRIFEAVIQKLKCQHIDTSAMVLSRFKCLLPKAGSSAEQMAVYETLLRQPMVSSTADLCKVMSMQLFTKDRNSRRGQDGGKEGYHRFYIRSWTFAAHELRRLTQFMKLAGYSFRQLEEWDYVRSIFNRQELTIRYVGVVKGRRDPYERFTDDLNYKSKNALLQAFHQSLETVLPHIAAAAKVHVIDEATMKNDTWNVFNAGDIEMFLIQLFGHHTLLNSQLGGFYCNYLPRAADDEAFKNLQTDYFRRCLLEAEPFSDDDQSSISTPFRIFQSETKEAGHIFTNKLREITERQATLRQFCGVSILLFLGEGLTQEHFDAECGFLEGPSRASHWTRSILRRLLYIESNLDYRASSFSEAFPFINLCPLPRYKDAESALSLLRSYLQLARPLLVSSFGSKAASVAKADFKVNAKAFASIRPYPSLGSAACCATLQFCGPTDRDALIHVPLIHPGSLNYGHHNTSQLRLFYISMQHTLFVASCAMNVIKEHVARGSNVSRKILCLDVLDEADRVLKTKDGLVFASNITQARLAFNAHCQYLRRKFSSTSWSEQIQKHIRQMKRDGRSLKEIQIFCQGQLERRQEEQLHCDRDHIQYSCDDELVNEYEENNTWLSDLTMSPQDRQYQELHERKRIQDAVPRRQRALFPDKWRPAAEIDGIQIKPNPVKGKFIIRWNRPDGIKASLRLAAPMIAVPKVDDEIRTISFTIHGLDIVGADGTAFRQKRGGVMSAASITRDQFLSTEAGQTLVDLWQAVLIDKGIDWSTPSTNLAAKDWGTVKGVDRIRARTKTEKPRQNRPLDPSDANYLLNEFILERFAQGGLWCTAPMDKIPESTGDTEAFLAFLKRPEYVAHPYTNTWLSDLDSRSDHLVLIPNLRVLRETNHKRIQKWVPSLKAPVWFLNIQIGPPGSAALTEPLQSNKRPSGNPSGGPSRGTASNNFPGCTPDSDASDKSKKRPRCAAKDVNDPVSLVEESAKESWKKASATSQLEVNQREVSDEEETEKRNRKKSKQSMAA